jgi:DsbC/DsbD-like thiol-disulfide interchange protein
MHSHARNATALTMLVAAMLFTAGQASSQTEIEIRPEDASGMQKDSLSAKQLVRVRLDSDVKTVAPGQTFYLAALFSIAPGWHIYWANPGASGAPTTLSVTAPEGFTVGRTLFPRPTAFTDEVGITYGYAGNVTLLVPVTAPDVLEPGEAGFKVDASYLVCRESCLLGDAQFEHRLRTAPEPVDNQLENPETRILRRKLELLPRPLDELPGAKARLERGRLLVTGPADAHETIEFFPLPVPGVTFGEPDVSVTADRFRVVVRYEVKPQNVLDDEPLSVRGLVGLGNRRHEPCYYFELPLAEGG